MCSTSESEGGNPIKNFVAKRRFWGFLEKSKKYSQALLEDELHDSKKQVLVQLRKVAAQVVQHQNGFPKDPGLNPTSFLITARSSFL